MISSFATIVVISLTLAIFAFGLYTFAFSPRFGINKNLETLKNGDFEELNIEQLAGKNGSIKIVNEEGNVIFPYNTIDKIADEELVKIPLISIFEVEFISKSEFSDRFNTKNILISQQTTSIPENDWFILLDENYNVISQSANSPFDKKNFTEEEIENILKSEHTDLKYKYEFEYDNKTHVLIIELETSMQEQNLSIMSMVKYLPIVLLIVYIAATFTFVGLLNRRVTKPLSRLDKAMSNFANDRGTGHRIDTKGTPVEVANLIEAYNNMTEEIEEADKLNQQLILDKQEMLADISHDLKTPITVIKGYSKALVDGVIKEEEFDKYLKIIAHKSEELNELINVFHIYSKMDHPQHILNLETINLSEMMRRYVAKEYDYITSLGSKFEFDLCENEIICDIDETEFQRAITNIVSNAIKYNERGLTLRVSLIDEDENAILNISDDGAGIDEGIVKDIFSPFVVGDESRNPNHGSGLGLAITKTIVEKHGGTITLNEEITPNFNTNFKITIPKKVD